MSARLEMPTQGIVLSQPRSRLNFDLGGGTSLKWPAITTYGSNPIVSPSLATPVEVGTYTPQVVRIDATTWRMLFKSERGITISAAEYNCIKAAESSDGLSWSRMNSDDAVIYSTDAWESAAGHHIEQPLLYFDGTTFHAYYTAGGVNTCAVGYATSTDMVTWSKSGSNPIMELSDFISWPVTAEWFYLTRVIADHLGSYWGFGWCGEQDGPTNLFDTRLWYSKGTSWTDLTSTTPPTPIMTSGSLNGGMQTERGVFGPEIIKLGSTYYMHYWVNCNLNHFHTLETRVASSSDLINWTKAEVFPFLLPEVSTIDVPVNWNREGVYTPHFLQGNTAPYLEPQSLSSKHIVYFSGVGEVAYSVGRAELADTGPTPTAYDNTLVDYKLDEGTGTDIADSSDYANNQTLPTNALWVPEESSIYNGRSPTGITIAHDDWLQRDMRTIECWATVSVDGRGQYLFTSGNATGGSAAHMSLYMTGAGIITFDVRNVTAAAAVAITDLDYHHIVGVYDADNCVLKLYVDGALAGSRDISVNPHKIATWGNRPLVSGYASALSERVVGNGGWTGKVKDFQVHRLPLTATQILQRYQRGPRTGSKVSLGVDSLTDDLVARWGLGESAGSQRDDSVGTSHLTDTNTVTTTTGKNGNCAVFAGASSQKLSVADNATLSVAGSSYTLAFWFYRTASAVMGLVGKYSGTAATSAFLAYLYSDNKLYWDTINSLGAAGEVATPSAVSANAWHLAILDRNIAANTLSLQLDDGAIVSGALADGNNEDTNDFTLGFATIGSPSYFTGRIDEVMFWKRILTAKERSDLWGNQVGRFYPGF